MSTALPVSRPRRALTRPTTPGVFVAQIVQILGGVLLLGLGAWRADSGNLLLGFAFILMSAPSIWTQVGPKHRKLSDSIQGLSLGAGEPASTALNQLSNLPEDPEDALRLLYEQVKREDPRVLETAGELADYSDFNVQTAAWSVIGRYGGAKEIERTVAVARDHFSLGLSKHPVLEALEQLQSRHPEDVARATAELERNHPRPTIKPFLRGLKLWTITTVSCSVLAATVGGLYLLLGSGTVSIELLLVAPELVLLSSVLIILPMVLIGSASVKAAERIDRKLRQIRSGTATYNEGQVAIVGHESQSGELSPTD